MMVKKLLLLALSMNTFGLFAMESSVELTEEIVTEDLQLKAHLLRKEIVALNWYNSLFSEKNREQAQDKESLCCRIFSLIAEQDDKGVQHAFAVAPDSQEEYFKSLHQFLNLPEVYKAAMRKAKTYEQFLKDNVSVNGNIGDREQELEALERQIAASKDQKDNVKDEVKGTEKEQAASWSKAEVAGASVATVAGVIAVGYGFKELLAFWREKERKEQEAIAAHRLK